MRTRRAILSLLLILTLLNSFSQRKPVRPPKTPTHYTPRTVKQDLLRWNEIREKLKSRELTKQMVGETRSARYKMMNVILQQAAAKPENAYFFLALSPFGQLSIHTNFNRPVSSLPDMISVTTSLKAAFESRFPHTSFEEIAGKANFIIDFEVSTDQYIAELFKYKPQKLLLHLPEGDFANVSFIAGKLFYRHQDFFIEKTSVENFFRNNLELSQTISNSGNLVISLINNDSKTASDIKKDFPGAIQMTESNAKDWQKILLQNKSRRIFIVGHCENGHFVSRTHKGTKEFEINMSEIEKFAAGNNMSIHNLGCESIKNNSTSGFAEPVNSVKLVQSLKKALQTSTLSDFFNMFSLVNGVPAYVTKQYLNNNSKYEMQLSKEITGKQTVSNVVFIFSSTIMNTSLLQEEDEK